MSKSIMSTDQKIMMKLKLLRVYLNKELGDINNARCSVAAILYDVAEALDVSPAHVLGYKAFTQLVYSDECPE